MNPPHVRDAGDSMLLVEFEPVVDPTVNARVVAIADALRERRLGGIIEIRATFRSVAVDYDPLRVERAAVVSALESVVAAAPRPKTGRHIEVPVAYGGENGADLDEVAARSGMEARAIVRAHADRDYHAFMVGFMPGFAYLGPVPEGIVAPRRATPRVRVPAGSVGIAGRQTGVYPRACPGGWALVGRTNVPMFDPATAEGSLVRPGDRVRFLPVDRLGALASPGPAPAEEVLPGDSALTVIRPGLLTTVQDGGRVGHQDSGVPVGGALDAVARRVANRAVGNAPGLALLEAMLPGLEIRFERDCVVALGGADLGADIDGTAVALGVPVTGRAGSSLRLAERRRGARAYVAFAGGVSVPLMLGSRATELGAGFGGFFGRALRAGDRLPVGDAHPRATASLVRAVPLPRLPAPGDGVTLRVLLGPHDDWFSSAAVEALLAARFHVTPNSNRVGYRLQGSVPLERSTSGEMISDATVIGGVQVPPDGQPILLMADRQVTGGYPIVATVITADLPLAAQLAPGDWVQFAVCSRSAALAALRDVGTA